MRLATERVTLHAGVVIVHPEMGIYLGGALGMGFFSKLDPVGQDCAATFEGLLEARRHIQSWDTNNDPKDYKCVRVFTKERNYATVAECMLAGLDYWDSRTAIDPWMLLGKYIDHVAYIEGTDFLGKSAKGRFTELELQELTRLSNNEPEPITRKDTPEFYDLVSEKRMETSSEDEESVREGPPE